jgi:hypothetical protein
MTLTFKEFLTGKCFVGVKVSHEENSYILGCMVNKDGATTIHFVLSCLIL